MILGSGSCPTLFENLNCACPKCFNYDTTVATIEHNYISILFVPFIPTGKSGYTTCAQCGTRLIPKQMPIEMRKLFNEVRKQGTTEWWMYSGLLIFSVLFSIGFLNNSMRQEGYRDLILSPKIGDIYTVHLDKEYSQLRYVSSSGAMSVFYSSNYVSNQKSGLKLLEISHKDDMFNTGKTMNFSQNDLLNMLDTYQIDEIKRP